MAMNKKETAELAEAKIMARINRALRWTDSVERDMPPPEPSNYTNGYEINSYGNNPKVYEAWSGYTCHGDGHIVNDKRLQHASQNSRSLFSTKLLALRALRSELEMKYAKQLAEIDNKIDAEIASEKGIL